MLANALKTISETDNEKITQLTKMHGASFLNTKEIELLNSNYTTDNELLNAIALLMNECDSIASIENKLCFFYDKYFRITRGKETRYFQIMMNLKNIGSIVVTKKCWQRLRI